MTTKIRLIFLAFITGCVCSSCSQKIVDSIGWQTSKVTVDGKISEWSNPLRFYDDKSKINYSITNDRQNLFLCMKVSDETSKAKILRGGMEFRIDTLGKKVFPIAFRFPLENQIVMVRHQRNETQEEPDPREKPNRNAMNQKMLNHATEAQLTGFKPPLGGTLPLPSPSSGIAAAITVDSLGILYYEALIPFRTFYKPELTPADSITAFCYEIKVNALPAPPVHTESGAHSGLDEGESGAGGGSGGMGGGMGGGHRGGMGGGGGHGGGHEGGGGYASSSNSDLYVSNHVIKKLRFSYK
jgi:hypothetical protein